jgi:thiosulfate/3-mercaptopyruvate sulfurtransferase
MPRRVTLTLLSAAAALVALACAPQGTPEPQPQPTAPTLPPPSPITSLTNTSASDYAHNRWGLIAAKTLEAFATNWGSADTAPENAAPTGRPKHVAANARLVVLQLNKANRGAGEDFVPSAPASNVFVYELDAFRFNETRDTGLISNSVRYQASGPTTDAFLAKYGIDLSRDFVVFAAGENGATNGGFFQDLARALYWLQYWGADARRLAIVNGTLKQNYTGPLRSAKTPESTVSNDGFTVKSLRVDNTGLTLALEDFQKVVDGKLSISGVITGFDKQFIIDARPTNQFTRTAPNAAFAPTHPGQFITTAWNSSGLPSTDAAGQAKRYVLFEGHVKGAVSFPWVNLLVDRGGNNWQYKPKADLEALFTAAGYSPGDKASRVVVSQCRTNFEVQVNGFAARLVLGYPTVHFDGSLIEYFSLVSNHPSAAFNLSPSDPAYRFRTDVPERSQKYAPSSNPEAPTTTPDDTGVTAYNVPTGTGPTDRKVSQAVVNKNATTTRKALDEDREYKRLVERPNGS